MTHQIRAIKATVEQILQHEGAADDYSDHEYYGEASSERRAAERLENELQAQGITLENDSLDDVCYVFRHGVLWRTFDTANWCWSGPEKNDWYYWSRNRYSYFIIFRNRDESPVAKATIKYLPSWRMSDGDFRCTFRGPCWTLNEWTRWTKTLEEGVAQIEEALMKVIAEEFKPEYVPPLG